MPSNFLEFNQGLPQIDKWKDQNDKIKEIMNYIKQLTEQLRYEFRHIRMPENEQEKILQKVFPLSTDKITEGILPTERGGTGAGNVEGARKNLGLGGLGTVTELQPGQVSLASGVWTEIGSVQPTKGTWLITAQVTFHGNTSGRRALSIDESMPEEQNRPVEGSQATACVDGGSVVLQATRLIQVTEDSKTLKIAAQQNSGSTINLPVIKIRTVQLCAG